MKAITEENFIVDIEQSIEISATPEEVFEGLIGRLTNLATGSDTPPLNLKLERKPGGRWYRDLGNDTGHFWGFVQSYKPPELLEIIGPMFMSYPVSGHIIIRLKATESGTSVSFRHRAFGLIDEEHREGLATGWSYFLPGVKDDVEK